MWATIIAALIAAAASTAAALITSRAQINKTITEVKTAQAVMVEEIKNLRREVEKHNGIVERTYKLETASALHDEQLRVANHRIADLEAQGK